MQMRTIEIVVGTFLLAGLISLAILAVRVSGFTVNPDQQSYTLVAKFDNIGGLVVRSKVSIAGVIVGTVTDIRLDQETFMAEVAMEINSEVNEISRDTTAAILTDGLLGGKFIGLSIGGEEIYLKEGDEIYDTQSAIILEELIGKFLLNQF
ncbi:MAG: phospholipid/cholesterol/gamma-HCH transport system substrate-binding protein [Patiriisocius sp.]|jgi:phospholipid/cholesterol/gamma-HCH transport system substrate-binding protein